MNNDKEVKQIISVMLKKDRVIDVENHEVVLFGKHNYNANK